MFNTSESQLEAFRLVMLYLPLVKAESGQKGTVELLPFAVC